MKIATRKTRWTQEKMAGGMKFSSKQDLEASIAFVFQTLTDFDHWERAAMRRGAEVVRNDRLTTVAAGASWSSRFAFRGKTREMDLKLVKVDKPILLVFEGKANVVDVDVQIELVEMSTNRTRMQMSTEVKPRTLGARLFLQSLRLARARVDKKYDQRVALLAMDLEARARAANRK